MWDRGLFCGLLEELADFGFAVACDLQEALGEFDGVFFGLCLDEGEAADDLFGFGEGAVGDFEFSAGACGRGRRVRWAGSLRWRGVSRP